MDMWLLIEVLVGAFSVHPVACAMAASRGILSIQDGVSLDETKCLAHDTAGCLWLLVYKIL